MKKTAQRFEASVKRRIHYVLEEKQWFFVTILAGIIFFILLVLYLVQYKNTAFIYSLF
jgi:uncharacterized integral membrane protein